VTTKVHRFLEKTISLIKISIGCWYYWRWTQQWNFWWPLAGTWIRDFQVLPTHRSFQFK